MSAYVVDDKTINRVVNWIRQNQHSRTYEWPIRQLTKAGYSSDSEFGIKRLAEEMFTLNCDAVEQRYGEGEAKEFRELNFQYQPSCHVVSIFQMMKSLRCWQYQCTEGNAPETALYRLMNDFCNSIALAYFESQPKYEQAEWD